MTIPPLPADLERRLQVAKDAVLAAGAVHRRYYGTNVASEAKTDPRDVLTQADLESQEVAKSVIRASFPDDVILGEEDGLPREALGEILEGACWTVDPLDGTQSFVHNFPFFGPGIAYVVNRRSLVGAIYFPVFDELFAAARAVGATLNGKPVHVSDKRHLQDAMVGVHIREVEGTALTEFLETTGRILPRSHGIRLLGAPMLNLAYVACGRLDCTATLSPSKLGPWDLAPAAVILEEAGGVIATQHGSAFDVMETGVSGAANQALLDEMFAVARGK
jgi:myo-inositol-1(or 4)-monophosphatase